MKTFDLFYLVFQSIKSRISRTLYTILGVAIGIGAILFLVSLGYGLQKILLEKITTKESLLTLDITPPENRTVILDDNSLERILKIPNVEKISPQAVFPGRLDFQGLISEVMVNVVDENFFVLGGIPFEFGASFQEKEKGKLVVNSRVQNLFGLENEKILGKKFKIYFSVSLSEGEKVVVTTFEIPKELEVVGVIGGEELIANVYLTKEDLADFKIQEYQFVKVKVKEDKFLERVREQLIEMGFIVSALSDTISQANKIFRLVQIILGIFGVVGLIVAGIGLINTMSITLLERTSEIGILRALGASKNDIRKLFLMESTISGFLGGIVGTGFGFVLGELLNFGMNILASALGGQPIKLFYYPFWFIIFILILSTLVGFIAGFWPARRAASLNPLEALRYK